MKTIRLLAFAVLLLVPARLGLAVAEPVAVKPAAAANPDVVLCLKKTFVRDASYDTFERVSPVERQIRGVRIRGTAATHGHAVVDFEESAPLATSNLAQPSIHNVAQPSSAGPAQPDGSPLVLILKIQGTTLTEAIGQQGKVRVHTQGTTEFTATKRIIFDGDKFLGQPTQVEVRHHTEIGRTTCPGGKFRQRLVERLGRPKTEAVRDVGDAMTRRETLQQVREGVDLEAGNLIALLNDLRPSVQAIVRLVPDEQPWRLRLSARGPQVLVACGGGDCRLGSAADFDTADRGPVQLWIRGELGPSAIRDILDGCQRINARLREDYAQRSGGKSPPTDVLAVESRREYLVITVAPTAFEKVRPKAEPEPAPAKIAAPQWAAAQPTLVRLTSHTPSRGAEPRQPDRVRRTAND